MKKLLFALLLFAIPSPAIAIEPINYPVNFIEWRGRVYNLDFLAGKAVQQVITSQPIAQPTPQTESREVRDNTQRVNYENARNLINIEYLQNQR